MKGYHYTTFENYQGIQEHGLLPSLLTNEDILEATSETVCSWLFQNPQEEVALFGILVERFAEQDQSWIIVELEVDFLIADCLKALHEDDFLLFKHRGSCGPWVYHEDEPIIIVSKVIPACQITLRRSFDLERAIS